MSQTMIIDHKGKKVLLMDFSNTNDKAAIFKTIEDIKALAKTLPEDKSMLGLVDITGSTYDKDIVLGLKELATHNKPYMKMTACVGVTDIRKIILQGIITFSGRSNLVIKDSRDQALDWLVGQ